MPPPLPGDMGYAPRMNDAGDVERGERGYRRKKFAAMAGAVAGNIYRTGQIAVTEIRETYAQSKARGLDGDFDGPGSMHIPGAFPGVAITSEISPEQMMLFPCYAKQHTKKEYNQPSAYESETAGNLQDEDYWRSEWERHQDERAIVDVDVRGWIYSPHSGPMTRRNRILIGLARQLSGIPVPRADPVQGQTPPTPHDEWREQEKIAQEAARIEQQGREEKRIANVGAYSEAPREDTGLGGTVYPPPPPRPPRRDSRTPDSLSGSPRPPTRQNSAMANELTEAELATANANLMARIAPFLTTPSVSLPITIFFYNDSQSQSRNVLTDDSGHFAIRAPLEFVPTHIKVLVNEGLSTTQPVKYIEPYGVSLISDIDDTVKMSNISAGAKEIFRNTFVRELADLTIDGVKEWYREMQGLGVSIHYCSNSPWQLFPMLATFFKVSGLPVESLHLKQYSGMLQGIFEPVAERKKNTLVRLLRDFPQRKFLLVGDSGEADLEVYTDLALAYPGRILAVFIRDVTTPEAAAAYFEPSFDMTRRTMSGLTLNSTAPNGNRPAVRQNSSPGPAHTVKAPPPAAAAAAAGPVMGTLIDFSDEPEEVNLDDAAALEQIKASRPGPSASASAADLLARKPPPPPRPAKPAALASAPSIPTVRKGSVGLGISGAGEPPPPLPRRPVGQAHPLSQIQNSSQQTVQTPRDENNKPPPPPPPPPPRRSVRNLSPKIMSFGRGPSSNSDVDFDPLPPSIGPAPVASITGLSSFYRPGSRSGNTSPSASPTMAPVNKKLELWRRRLARAQDQLDQLGVALYTWRRGQDVEAEAVGIIKRYLAEVDRDKEKTKARRGWGDRSVKN